MQESIGFLLDDTARLYRRDFNARVRAIGTTALQWRLMMRIARFPGIRQSLLAEMIEVEPITLSRMIVRLADDGLIERRPDPADRRAWQLFLSSRGLSLMDGARPLIEEQASIATDGLSPEERTKLIALVERVRANLSRRVRGKTRD